MSILGSFLKKSVTVVADALDSVINKSSDVIQNKFGENQIIQTTSEISSSTVRVSESTIKTLADVVDGGIDAGVGYLSDNESKKKIGMNRMKTASKDILKGMEQGVKYTFEAGSKTTSSAAKAGKHYLKGNKKQAELEFKNTKGFAKDLGKIVVIGLLAFGVVELGKKNKDEEN